MLPISFYDHPSILNLPVDKCLNDKKISNIKKEKNNFNNSGYGYWVI